MPKLTFYVDLWPGMSISSMAAIYATTTPHQKNEGTKRWAFEVTIPDDVLHDVDGHAAEVTRPRLVEDGGAQR
jgi:hypothetical protein